MSKKENKKSRKLQPKLQPELQQYIEKRHDNWSVLEDFGIYDFYYFLAE